MESSTYFYLEPYVYIASGENGVLLINMLDDQAFVFNDSRSTEIIQRLMSSAKKSVRITEQDKSIPLISNAINHFMGDLISSTHQPLQFDSEINNISGVEAYHKSIIYSKYNIGALISTCTLFIDMNDFDCMESISYKSGLPSTAIAFRDKYPKAMNKAEVCTYIQGLVDINPNIVVNICGLDFNLMKYIIDNFDSKNLNPIVSATTLNNNPEIQHLLDNNTDISFSILLNLLIDNVNLPNNKEQYSILTRISNKTELDEYFRLIGSGYKIKFSPNLNGENLDFIISLLSISEENLLNLPRKYQTIKVNNLINSNLWGNIYLFSGGDIYYSFINAFNKSLVFDKLYDSYKEDLINGSIDWIFNRNYPQCKKCIYQRLCPPPNYIEHYLRDKQILRCLISATQ